MQKQQRSRVGKIALAKKLVIVFIEKDYYTFTPAKLRLFYRYPKTPSANS